MAFEVAPMQAGDIPDVLAITEAAAARGEQDAQLTVARLQEELARPWAHLWIVRGGAGQAPVLGFFLGWHVADEFHVLDVGTHGDARRRGVARTLMNHAIDFARDRGCAHVLLEVRRSNPAVLLYRACGFRAMGVRRRYYPDDEDAVDMMLFFDPMTRAVLPGKDEVAL